MRIVHIAMFVNDLDAARDFFVRYFHAKSNEGYHNQTTDFRSYFLSFDDGARLEIMKKTVMEDAVKGIARTGYIHFAFVFYFDIGCNIGIFRVAINLRRTTTIGCSIK